MKYLKLHNLKKGYYDPDYLISNSIIQIFINFFYKELDTNICSMDFGVIEYMDDEVKKSTIDNINYQIDCFDQCCEILDWIEEYLKNPSDYEFYNYDKVDEMLHKIINIRRFLWT